MSKYYEGKTQKISKIYNLKSILYLQDTAYNITECITVYLLSFYLNIKLFSTQYSNF